MTYFRFCGKILKIRKGDKMSDKNNNNKDILKKIKEYFAKNGISTIILAVLIMLYFLKSSALIGTQKQDKTHYVPYNEFVSMLEKDEVEYIFLQDGSSSVQFLPSGDYFAENRIVVTEKYEEFRDRLKTAKDTYIEESMLPTANFKYVTENPGSDTFKADLLTNSSARVFSVKPSGAGWMTFLYVLQMFAPIILFLVILGIMQKRMEPQDNEVKTVIPNTKFDDIAGYKGLKKDIKFILDFLKNPRDYEKMGARLPNGVLFYGPPGTGKTLMARAIAGEAGVPFYNVNGSDFVELYVGLGARRVRKLYKTARENAPCIIFIDEIDSIGGARGNFRGSSEDDKTLTALLNELDGFASKEGVMTIAATNRLDDLDAALVRPGRFDRQVAVPLPDREERLEVLEMYKKGKKISNAVSMDKLSEKTIEFSPAELENLLNEAAIIAVTKGKKEIEQEDIDNSYLKIIIKGDKKENKHQTEEEKKVIAYHEAGHAVVNYVQGTKVLEVSVIGTTSGAGGYTLSQPKEGLSSKADMKNRIRVAYGGRAAETIIAKKSDEITVGAVSDIEHATKIISAYIKYYGLNGSLINIEEFGVTKPNNDMIKEANKLANELFEETIKILEKNREKLDRLAETLLDKKLINAADFIEIMEGEKKEEEPIIVESSTPNDEESGKKEEQTASGQIGLPGIKIGGELAEKAKNLGKKKDIH